MFNAKLLASLRKAQRYSQRELAEAAGVPSGFIASLEAEGVQSPGAENLLKVAKLLGVSPELFFESGAKNS